MAISNASNQIVKVNLIPGIISSVLHLSQYDTGAGRPITFSVYDGSQAFTIPSGVSIAFEGTKPDGNGFSFTCSKSGSNALLTNYTNQMTALSGKIMCQLVFTDTSGGRVGSLPVLMVVTPAGINGDTVISDSDIEAIVAAQNQYAVLNARLDATIDQMNTTTNKAIDQMNTKANDLQNQYDVTNAKLDTAISAATQDSEVQDIRVKADGTSAATAGDAVREQITELKNDLNSVVYGTDKTFAVERTEYHNVPCVLIDGSIYTYTNNTSAGTNLLLLKSDGTTTVVSTNVAAGASASFVVDGNDYVAIRFYANATGSVSIEGGYSLANARDAVREQITELKNDLNSVVYGIDKTFTVEKAGYYNIECVLVNGATYTFSNNTTKGTNLLLLKKDDSTTVVSTNVKEGTSISFVVDGDDYVAIRFYADGTGSVSITGGYSLVIARDEIDAATVMHGIELHPGYINASGGISDPSSTSQEVYTDKILCDTGFEFSLSLTYASADTMWVAYALYDESGAFIGRTTLDGGVSRLSYTYTITITNTNARYIAFTFRTHGNCVSVIKSPQYTSILDIKIGDIDDRLSSVENATQMSATAVRSVNHRGYNTVAPENTLPAYKLSRKMGFDAAETDVAFTSDGVAVLLHDSTINRTARNADGTEITQSIDIGTITYEQALQYDFGIWKGAEYAGTKIPTFTQFIQLCKRIGLSAYVELKPTGTTEARVRGLIDTVKNCGMTEHVTWISFYPSLLTYVKNYDSTARIGLVTESITAETVQTAENLKTTENEVFIDSDVYNADAVAVCANANLPLEVWTINNQTVMENLDPYITGATSDSLIFGRVLYNKYIQ